MRQRERNFNRSLCCNYTSPHPVVPRRLHLNLKPGHPALRREFAAYCKKIVSVRLRREVRELQVLYLAVTLPAGKQPVVYAVVATEHVAGDGRQTRSPRRYRCGIGMQHQLNDTFRKFGAPQLRTGKNKHLIVT